MRVAIHDLVELCTMLSVIDNVTNGSQYLIEHRLRCVDNNLSKPQQLLRSDSDVRPV